MNLPNLLTLLRIFFVPLLVAALLSEEMVAWFTAVSPVVVPHDLFALFVFLSAAATDLLDGYLARRWGQITTVGTLLDPIADKLLVSSALIALVQIDRVSAWFVILIIGREFVVSGLRSIAASAGYVIEASDLGKTKMAAQVIAIAMVIAGIHWPFMVGPSVWAMWTVVAFGVVSAADYFRKFWRKVDQQVKSRRRKELLDMERQKKRSARAVARAGRGVTAGR